MVAAITTFFDDVLVNDPTPTCGPPNSLQSVRNLAPAGLDYRPSSRSSGRTESAAARATTSGKGDRDSVFGPKTPVSR